MGPMPTPRLRIALVNCAVLPEPDPDEAPLLAALRELGHDARTMAWDDPAQDPAAFDACVLRACWNYYRHLPAFTAWLDRAEASARMVNPLPIVRWNLHKRYLLEIEAAGVPIVPTAFVDRGAHADLAAIAHERGWDEVVVKPAESAGSWQTRRFAHAEFGEGSAFLAEITAERDAMVQRFEPAVATIGETSLVWIDGELTHAVEKRPRFAGQDESVLARPAIEPAQRALAEAVLSAVPGRPTYARIDLFPDGDGGWMLSELELIEPSLFFELGHGSARRLARAIADSTTA